LRIELNFVFRNPFLMNRKWNLPLLILLLISLGANVFQYLRTRDIILEKTEVIYQLDTLAQQKQELDLQFNLAMEELEAYQGKSAELDSLLAEAYGELARQKSQIARLIDERQDAEVLRQRYEDLRRIKDEYLERIVALEEENRRLKYEVNELSVALDQRTSEARNLQGKVEVASKLIVSTLSVTPMHLNKNKSRPSEQKARRTNALDIQFTIEENRVAPRGEIIAYLRIFNPQGYVVADVGQIRKFSARNGDELPYSKAITIDFDGSRTSRQINWEQEVFSPGEYKVEVYLDGELVSSQKTTLY
jgi:cell division protein FtsL